MEDRTNPSSLTVSFVPDGTQVGALQSQLYQDNTGTSPAVWQQQIVSELQAVLSAASQTNVTLSIVPDDGASMNAAAPQDGALRIAGVDELFTSNGTVVTPAAGTDFLLVGGSAANTFGSGVGGGLTGPGGLPLSPYPTPPGGQSSGSLPPLILGGQKASGNLYPPAPPPPPAPQASPDGTTPTGP